MYLCEWSFRSFLNVVDISLRGYYLKFVLGFGVSCNVRV